VLAEREYLVAVIPRDEALALITLHYSDETRPEDGIAPKKGKTAAEEENRIKKSIRQMIEDFHPEKYADERRKRVMSLLEAKAKEKPPVEAPAVKEEEEEGPADLVAALEESMRKVKSR